MPWRPHCITTQSIRDEHNTDTAKSMYGKGMAGGKAVDRPMCNIGRLAFSNARKPNYSPSANAVKLGTAPK